MAAPWVPPSPRDAGRGASTCSSAPSAPLPREREREGPTAQRWEGEGRLQPFFLGGTGVWATVLEPALEAVTGATAKKNFAGLVAT